MNRTAKVLLTSIVLLLALLLGTGFSYAQSTQKGTVTTQALRLRSGPGLSYGAVGELQKGQTVSIIGQSGNWLKVQTNSGKTSWVDGRYIKKASAVTSNATVSASAKPASGQSRNVTTAILYMRSGPGTTYKVVGSLKRGQSVVLLDKSGNWAKVQTSSGKVSWVNSKYLSVSKPVVETVAPAKQTAEVKPVSAVETSRSDEAQTQGAQLAEFAKRYLGVGYVWGGSSPSGFDCSGFVKFVYGNFGITLNRVAADQATEGTPVSKDDLQVGDLVFFDTDGGHNYINHVGMYIGNGSFIQASSGRGCVVISDITTGFYADAYMTARRILK
ncbi:MAG: SH3 domain-containing protein [Bacillota bacterium]|nr:SH3 domain-containing protein [Bacillota bacterium]